MLTVSTRLPGARRAMVPDFQMPLPPEADAGGELLLRDLLAAAVRCELAEQTSRAGAGMLGRVLTAQQIADGAAEGKIVPAGREPGPPVDADQAVGAAWQAFADGLYLVFVDGQPQHALDDLVTVRAGGTVAFVRLMMLRGAGRW